MFGLLFQQIYYYNSMNKFLVLILSLFLTSFGMAIADDVDTPATGDLWDNWQTDQNFYGNKPVTDEEFDKAVEKIDAKKNKWKKRAEKKNLPKGEEFRQSNESEMLKSNHGDKASLPVLCLPFEIVVGEDVVPVGHYQLKCEKIDGQLVLKLYQAHYVMAQIPAIETEEDFDEESIFFAKWFDEGNNKIKIIYGSLDYNAYAIVQLAN